MPGTVPSSEAALANKCLSVVGPPHFGYVQHQVWSPCGLWEAAEGEKSVSKFHLVSSQPSPFWRFLVPLKAKDENGIIRQDKIGTGMKRPCVHSCMHVHVRTRVHTYVPKTSHAELIETKGWKYKPVADPVV